MAFDGSTLETATTGAFVGTVFSDTFSISLRDVDMIRLNLTAGRRYQVDVDNGLAGDLYLRIFDAFGNEVKANDDGFRSDDNEVFSLSPWVEFTPNYTGTYYVAISPYYLQAYDPNTVSGRPAPENPIPLTEGTLRVSDMGTNFWAGAAAINLITTEDDNDETDNLRDEDRSLRVTYFGAIDIPTDVDMARMDLSKGDLVVIDVNGLNGNGTFLRVFDAGGAQIASDTDSGFGEDPELVFAAPSATAHYVGISGEGNFSYDALTGAGTVAGAAGDFEVIVHLNPTKIGNSNSNVLNGTANGDYMVSLAGNDIVNGNDGNDTLAGGDDQDTITGGAASDVLYGEHGDDTLSGDAGRDVLMGGIGNDLLNGGVDDDLLDGGSGNDTMTGGEGIDTLSGGSGQDILVILAGDDGEGETYGGGAEFDTLEVSGPAGSSTIDLRDDNVSGIEQIRFAAGGGMTLQMTASQVASQVISIFWDFARTGPALLEIDMDQAALSLSGFGFSDALRADDAFRVNGTGAAETIFGSGTSDRLVGGGGVDTLTGGLGNDTYVNPLGDIITELAAGGTDTVESIVTFSLASIAQVENLILTGAANINASGNALGNVLTGNSGNNILNGNGGADTMIGGAGNDIYYVDTAGDVTTELSGGGTDLVSSSVSRTLSVNIENLNLSGTANIDGNGNTGVNIINGNAGNNILRGDAGADTLNGGGGNDILLGGTSSDSLNPGVDAVRDIIRFSSVADSTGAQRDIVTGMDLTAEDVFDFTVVPTSIVFVGSGALNLATINTDLAAAVDAALAVNGAVLFDPNAGDMNVAGHLFVVVDANGDGVYRPNQDYLVQLNNSTGFLTLDDFI
jgi:Ca2+-binding RTX toxin-like protein